MADKIDQLYDALKADGAVQNSRENFRSFFLAKGSEGYNNRKSLYDALKADGAVQSPTYEDFMQKFGWDAVKPAAKPQQAPTAKPQPTSFPQAVINELQGMRGNAGQKIVEGLDYIGAIDHSQDEDPLDTPWNPTTKQPQPAKRMDATQFGVPYKPDTEMTAAQRDEVYRQNDFAVKQLKKFRDDYRGEQARRNRPIVDTGSPEANSSIIKTQGQWEDELQQGASKISHSVVVPAIDKAIVEFDKKADEIWGRYNEQSKFVDAASPMSVSIARQANEAKDPEKILNFLQQQMENLYNDSSFIETVGKEADKMGVDREEYIDKVIKPQIKSDLASKLTDKLVRRELPKSTSEYILNGLENSIAGMLFNALTESKGQRGIKNQAAAMTEEGQNPYYNPGTGAKLTQMGVSFAADAPFFGVYGKVSGQVAKNIAEREIKKLIGKGLSESAARSIVGSALENSVGTRMKNYIMQHVVSGSLTMGAYNATSEFARQTRDKEGYDIGRIAGSTAEGLAVGAAFGLTGGASQALSQPLSGISKIGAKVAGYGAEAETMYATEELAKLVHGEDAFTNPFEGSGEALMKLGVMKLSGGHLVGSAGKKLIRAKEVGVKQAAGETLAELLGSNRTGVKFTEDEQNYIRNSQEGKDLVEALSNMHPEVAISEVNGKKKLTKEGEQMRQQLSENYDRFMTNTEIPASAKQKVAYILGGVYRPGLETGADIIHNTDGSVILKTRDKDGNCIQDLKFDSFSDAEAWREMHTDEFKLNDAVNSWNQSPEENRREAVTEIAETFGIPWKDARDMVYKALDLKDTSLDKDQYDFIFNAITRNAYPEDEYNPKRRYWEGSQMSAMERHFAQTDVQLREEELRLQGEAFAEEVIAAADYADEKLAEIAAKVSRGDLTAEQLNAAKNYYNATAKLNGVMDEALKSVDNQVEAANAYVRKNTHTDSGMMIEGRYKGRDYYITAGHFQISPDGKLIPTDNSGLVILRDKETGDIVTASPNDILVNGVQDPKRIIEHNESMEGLRGQLVKEADDTIELNPDTPTDAVNGDIYMGTDGNMYMAMEIQDEAGNPVWSKVLLDENGEPTGNPMPFDIEEYRKAKSDALDAENIPPEKAVAIAEGQNEKLNQEAENAEIEGIYAQNPPENIPETQQPAARIPVDEKGRQIFEQAKPEDTIAELTEKYGDDRASQMVDQMIINTSKKLTELEQKDMSDMTDMNDIEAHEDEISDLQRKLDYWNGVKQIIDNEREAKKGQGVDSQHPSGEAGRNGETGQDEIQAQGAEAQTGADTEQPKAERPEAATGEPPVSDTDVSGGELELDQEGKPFISAPNGTTTFGLIDSSKNIDEAPIKLSQGDKSHGYEHMEIKHGKQIRGKGFKSIEDFVDYVAKNYTVIKEGVDAGGNPNGTYLLQAVDNHNNTLYIELSKDGSYWNVNSGGVFRKNYGDKLKTIWSASEVQNKESAPDNTSHPKPNADKADGSNGTVPNTVSGGKDTKNNNTIQGNQQKNDKNDAENQPIGKEKSKLYLKTVESNTGRSFTFTNGSGGTSVLNLQRIDHEGNAVVIRQDYDAQGNAVGEPREERYPFQKVGNAILTGTWKKKLNTDEELRQNHKYHSRKVGDVPIIDVLADNEKEQILDALRSGDKEKAGYLEGDFINQHREDLIMRGREIRNEKVEKAMSRGSKAERLRAVRDQYRDYDEALSMLEDGAMEPQSIEEYVADALGDVPKPGTGFLAYESYDQGGNKIIGLKDESGFGKRGFTGDTKGFNPWLAPKGQGISLKQLAERIRESLPEGMKEQFSDQDIRNVINNVMTGAEKPTDIANYILNSRLEQAEASVRRMEDDMIDDAPAFQKMYGSNTFANRLQRAKESVNAEPTDGQKKAGNYKKGHISFGGYDFTIENPAGSTRRGESNGKKWEQKMNNTYGYILGKRGKDGDHLDMFINDKADLDNWNGNVYVVDQIKPDGSFDEHKILYGFDSEAEAREAYLSNYEKDWKGLGKITGVDKATFDKWLDASDYKIKDFADYSIVKHKVERQMRNFDSALKQLEDREISIDNPDLLKEYGLKNVVLSKMGDHLTLTHFIAAEQGKGNGTRFMEDLARLADEKGWTLALTPDTSFGGTSVKRLKDFYKRFGFVDNKGRNSDFFTRESMIRRPKEFMEKPENQEKVIRDAVVEHLKSIGINVSTNWKLGQKILDDYNKKLEVNEEPDDQIKSQKVTDQQELDELNKGKTVKRYRAMQLIDGKLYPPMSAKVDGQMRQPTEIGVWEKAEERPDLVKNGKFVLNKGQKGQGNVPAAYNPYFHTSTSGLNDQFTSAYKRPELVVVEVEIPESELTSGYKAEGAKDAVGNVDWHSGVVNGQLPADRQRQVTLSRYNKVNRIVPDSEVADMIAKQLEGTDIEVPYNVVTPALRAELEKRGVKISDKPAGSVTEDINGKPIRYQKAEAPIFVSNALKAIEAIKQEKATPDQWLAMLQKNGGLKAGEDKWLGLSDWLKEQKEAGKSVTKQELLDYIRQNQIEIEETHYKDFNEKNHERLNEFNDEFHELMNEAEEETGSLYTADHADWAYEQMKEKYGDDFEMAFDIQKNGNEWELVPQMNWNDEITEAALYFLEDGEKIINSTRHQYTTEGLDNKKEIALTVPNIEPYNEGDQVHFGDAGGGRAVAWIRFGDAYYNKNAEPAEVDKQWDAFMNRMAEKYGKDRKDITGLITSMSVEEREEMFKLDKQLEEKEKQNMGRILVIDEIQSKRHQDAREKGYKSSKTEKASEAYSKANSDLFEYEEELSKKYNGGTWWEKLTPEETAKRKELKEVRDAALRAYNDIDISERGSVPEAPFEKNWHELAMKRMLRYAAENGYDKIAWTTGGQQAERYNLGTVIDEIGCSQKWQDGKTRYDLYPKSNDGSISLFVKDGKVINSADESLIGKDLSEVVGKDVAEKMQNMQPDETLSNDDLLIGGEGMKGFYDQILPRFMDKYGKKWGVKTGTINLPDLEKSAQTMHSIDVTPEMKESVMQGQPMFFKTRDGHAYGYTKGGKIYIDPRIATSETPVHEYDHLWCEMKRQTAPEEWNNIKQVMLNDEAVKPIIDRVKRDYEELTKEGKEDDFVEEVITQFSGKRGAERLREVAEEVAKENGGIFGKAEAITAMQRLKSILNRFWEGVAKMMGWKYKNANQIADRMMADMLNGVDPTKIMKDATSGNLRPQAEIERTLMGVHNLSEDKLRKVLKQGGLANPSLAVIDTRQHMHTDYGSISLIPKASLIDARTGRNAGTFTADAWTPTYPTVQKRMSDKGQDKFWKDLRTLREEDGEMANFVRMAFDTWLDKEVGQERLAYWYLKDKGMKPEMVRNKNPYGEDIVKRIDELTDNGNLEVSRLSEEQIKEVADMYHAYKESIGEPVTPAEERIKRLQERMNSDKPSPFLKLQQFRLDELAKYGELLHNLNEFEYAVRRSADSDGKPNVEATVNNAQKVVKDQNLQQDFDKWLQDKADSYGIEEWLYNGTDDRTGKQKWVRNTLQNASKLMKKEGLNGAVNWSSIGNWIAKVANKEKTLAGIRKNKKNLQTSEEEHEAFREKWSQVMYDIATKLGKGDSWIGENIMSDILDHKDYAGYLKREYGKELSKEDREAIDTFINEVQTSYPTGYFETKFERPVMLDEFEIAVVPENTSPDIVEALKNAGLDVRTYDDTGTKEQEDTNRTQATMDAVQGRDDIMFQMVGKEGAAEADRAEGNDERSRNLALAEDSEKAGVDPKAIKLATGWERGADGRWRYEIPDADVDILAKFNDKFAEMKADGVESPEPILKLGELLSEDNELFRYYPGMKDMPVLFSRGLPVGTAGAYDRGAIELNIKELNRFEGDDPNNENVYGTLLHEVQHAIQEKEGFALGGNLQTSTTEDGINAIIEKKERQRADIKTRLDANNKILSDPENLKMSAELEGKTEKEVKDQLTDTVDQQAAEYDTLGLQIDRLRHTKAPSMTDAKDLYHRLAGEVESRNVTERIGMTDEQRRQSLASETEDVPRDEQVIIMSDGKAMNINDIKPVGKGDFGDIYDQFKGKPKEAVEFLTKKKGGDLIGVFHRDEVGDIDLVWGESHNPYKGKGLSHIIKKHIDTLHDFKDIDELSVILDDVVNNGNMGDDYAIEKDGYRVVIAKEKDGKRWILTAFDNKKSKKEKLSSANTAGTPIDTSGSRAVAADDEKEKASRTSLNTPSVDKGEGAVSPDASLSEGKDTKNINSFQENSEKSSEEAPKFQRTGNPEPEITPGDRQSWNKWDDAMKKWKERNAIPADQTQAPEKPRFQPGENAMDYAQRLVQWNRMKSLWQTAPKLEDYRQVRDDKDIVEAARQNEQRYPDSPSAKMRRVASDMMRIRHAMSRQKAYDKATVKAVTDFAQDFMKLGFGDNLRRGEIERMLSSVKNATGAKDIKKEVDNIMNILIDNHLRQLDQRVQKLSSVKELSKTAQGVEKQGKLELKGQRMIQAFRDAREKRMTAEQIRERMAEVSEKMTRNDDEAPMWEQEYEGLSIALQYAENIEGSRQEWGELDQLYKDAVNEYKTSGRSYKAQQELLESIDQAMQENKIERIGLFGDIIGRLEGNISESMQGAKEFVEREKQRIKHIQNMANYDLAGKDMGAIHQSDWKKRLSNGTAARFFLSPLATFEQMLRQFGGRNANGEGYLYDHFMRSWIDSVDKSYVNEQKAKEELDVKAREVFGNKVKRWSDLYELERSLPTMEVKISDQGEDKTFTLNQGNLLYIYMADKMTDGRMKLRKMGIDEEHIEAIKKFLDPRIKELGDWIQNEYLPQKRTEYNKVHERMFGAPMAAIDNYFPIKILSDARIQEQDVANMADQDAVLPSTITGSIVKRRKNALPLDILGTDALSLAVEHIEDMERWAAQAEWNKDVNTLLSYTTFRNKVKNMNTIYGSGDQLWNTFADTARMAAGTYRPKTKPGSVDKAISNIAKGVTAAKINFRVYTAFKQILSAPAFLHDVNLGTFVKNSINPYGSWKWAMENMPVFQKRWKSRQVGDTRLMDDPTDWKMLKTNVVQLATRLGMSPNALVDGVTCAVGAKSIYETRYKQYKDIGASDEVARKRALQDAEIGYNLTQQSSEGAFVSAIQKDRTVAANMLSVFRNSSMAYTRQWVDAARNLRHRAQKGYKEDSIRFMAGQLEQRFDLEPEDAKKMAEAEYARAARHDVARLLNMMFGVTTAWNLGASLPYLLFGDDDHTKKEMLEDALIKGLVAGPTEGLAAGNIFSDFIGRTVASEQTRKTIMNEGWGAGVDAALKQGGDYEVNPLPLMADIQSMIKKMGYDKYAAAQDVFNICMQSAVGVNPQTFTDMWNACMDYGNPSWMPFTKDVGNDDLANSKEIALFIMRLMNAPTSSWRNKYIDELGMNAEDAKKLPYEEMARRYANYKHWKDAPIMGWLRDDESRAAKMEKIQKQFDDAVTERMERLTDEELKHNVARSESPEERRKYAKIIAQRLGLTPGDTSKKPGEDKWYQQLYQEKMQYDDIREDEMLASKLRDYREKDNQDNTKKEVNKRLEWIRNGKYDTPTGRKGKRKKGNEPELLSPGKRQFDTNGDEKTNEAIMQNIRKWRKEALEILMRAEADK